MSAATKAQQEHWERGQRIADELDELVAGIKHPRRPEVQAKIGDLRDFLADSHLPGENVDSSGEEG